MRRLVLSLSVMSLLAVMAAPATAQEVPPGGTFYDDDGNVHEGAIEAIASRGVTLGCDPDGTIYCVAESVTRDQMASFLARAFELPEAGERLLPRRRRQRPRGQHQPSGGGGDSRGVSTTAPTAPGSP